MHRPHRLVALIALALLGSAHALDAGGIAPALEAAFTPSVAYLDCPFHDAARTCVLVPGAGDVKGAGRAVLGVLHDLPGLSPVTRVAAGSYTFRGDDTVYRLRLAPSRARPGVMAATLSFAFDRAAASHAICLQPDALFDLARLPSLTADQYARMATAITCHGADPTDARGRTPLWAAVASANLAAVRTLLRGGADPNHITDDGWTPLLEAGARGTRPILDALLQAGGDPTYIAPDGATLTSLEPFNRRLTAPPQAPAGDAVLPRASLAGLPSGPAFVGRQAAGGGAVGPPAAAAGTASPPGRAAAGGGAALGPAHAAAQEGGTGAGARPARAGTRGAEAVDGGEGGHSRAAPAQGPSPGLPLAAVLLAVLMMLAVMRWRFRSSVPAPVVTDTAGEWQALRRPPPLSRERPPRRLEPVRPWSDR